MFDKTQRIKMANELMRSVGFGCAQVSKNTQKQLLKICNGRSVFDSRNDVYFYILRILKNVDDQEARALVFDVLKNLPVAYRALAIDVCKKLLFFSQSKKEASGYKYKLGLLYYKENRLAEAETLLAEAYSYYPGNYLACRWLAEVYVKQNKIDQALNILYDYKNSIYFKPIINNHPLGQSIDNTPVTYIAGAIKDIEDKKARGYIYRPRKKK